MDIIYLCITIAFFLLTYGLMKLCVNLAEKKTGRTIMNWLYLISGVISLCLLVYLFAALLKPEKFE